MIEFAEATLEDALKVLENVRGPQRRTIDKLGVDAQELLRKGVGNDIPSFCAFVEKVPAAVFGGYNETILGETRLWMLTTPLIELHKVPLLRWSKRYVQWMYNSYGSVIGMCDVEFPESRAWLRWIGFKEISSGDYIVMRYSGGH